MSMSPSWDRNSLKGPPGSRSTLAVSMPRWQEGRELLANRIVSRPRAFRPVILAPRTHHVCPEAGGGQAEFGQGIEAPECDVAQSADRSGEISGLRSLALVAK